MTPDKALARADFAGRIALVRGRELAERRDREHPLAGWHPLVIVAVGALAGGLCGRLLTRSAAAAVAVPLAAPIVAWMQAMPASALRRWLARQPDAEPETQTNPTPQG